MDRDDMLKKLESLAQLDTDAVNVYAEALEHVTDEEVHARFEQFMNDHMSHADKWSETIVRLGGERPKLTVDLMGHVADWTTAIRARRGTEGALHAMETAERYHVRRYGDAAAWDVDDSAVATMLEQFNKDEQHHLAYVQERLEQPAMR